MQWLKWFCSRNSLKLIFIIVFVVGASYEASAQYRRVEHTVAQEETLFKISILYSTEIDSLVKWNDLTTDSISKGQRIVIHDYYKLSELELNANELKYFMIAREKQWVEKEAYFNNKLDSLKLEKAAVDQSSPFALQDYFEISKQKKLIEDSIEVDRRKTEEAMETLRLDSIELVDIVLKKFKNKYDKKGNLIAKQNQATEKAKELENPIEDPIEELMDVIEQNERLAAEEAYAKQMEVEEKAKEEAKKKMEEEQEEKALAELQKKNEILAKKQMAEAKKEEEKLLQLAEEKAKEQEKLASIAKDEAEEKLKAELAAQKLEQEKLDQEKANESKKIAEEKALEEKKSYEEMTPQERDLAAMAAAKQAAIDKKAQQEKEKILNAQKKIEEQEKELAVQKIEPKKDEDVIVFDMEFETQKDTTSRRYKKQEKVLAKEMAQIEAENEKMQTVKIGEVQVNSAKNKKKLKMGDEVDAIRMEKSKFYLSRAMIEIDKKNYKKSVEYADKSIDLNPNYTEAYMLKGDVLASFGYYDKAYASYQNANLVNNRIPQLHYNMGNCLIYLGKQEKAIEEMGAAIRIDSSYILAYSGRSALYIGMKKYRSALKDYNTILSMNKYFYPAFKGRGIAHLNLGNYDDAIHDFNQLLEYDADDPSIYYHRGMAKMYKAEIYGACMDFLSSSERGYGEAVKAIKKYCD